VLDGEKETIYVKNISLLASEIESEMILLAQM
jgi:hypothetical protein